MAAAEPLIPVSSLLGLASCTLLVVAVGLLLFRAHARPPFARALLVAGLLGLMVIPVGGLPAAYYVRGLIGDLSVTTIVLTVAVCCFETTGKDLFDQRNFSVATALILAAALFLYPMTMGLTRFDPYALGYGSRGFELILLALALAAWALDLPLVVLCISLGIGAYLLRAMESRNLWDYLIDAPIAIYAVTWGAGAGIQWLIARRRGEEPLPP